MQTSAVRLAIGICCVALSTDPAGATNYYVATNGSNSNPGTLAQPFLTIQQAANVAQAGDKSLSAEGRTAKR